MARLYSSQFLLATLKFSTTTDSAVSTIVDLARLLTLATTIFGTDYKPDAPATDPLPVPRAILGGNALTLQHPFLHHDRSSGSAN